MTVFIRVLGVPVDDKADALVKAIFQFRDVETQVDQRQRLFFDADPASFRAIPRSPFAYWVGDSLRHAFRRCGALEQPDRRAVVGVATGDDARFVRCCWEVGAGPDSRWRLFSKGGAYTRYYADVHLCIDWLDDGQPIELSFLGGRVRKPDFFRPGLTWARRSQLGLGVRAMPAGCIFGEKGPTAFVEGNQSQSLLALLSIMTSVPFCGLVELQIAASSYDVGAIQRTPVPDLSAPDAVRLADLARRGWSLKRALDTRNETSHAFLLPAGLDENVTGLDRGTVEHDLELIQRRIDDAAFALYGIGPEDRAVIEAQSRNAASRSSEEPEPDDDSEGPIDEDLPATGGAQAVHSWLVGVAFGRFDPRLATGERPVPLEPEPFDPMPSRSPGMYPEGEEPADRPDLLVDDEGHAGDLAARAKDIAERVNVDVPENLRGWLAKEFFPLHIKMYSKSRRKAPIYWQLATPSATYSVWLYIHAFSKDTLFRVQNDYVAPKLAHEERRLESLTIELREGATVAQRKALAAQEALVAELRAFLDEVKRVAPLWNPNLDDGVVINFAPLWRLVPQNKPWQKELKSIWNALCEGRYDWANLAMHLWPERVVPKCTNDRSLAIAHDLEDVFWVEASDGKWTARNPPARSLDDLVRERTSTAAKSALKSLLEAPSAVGKSTGRARGGGPRKAAAVPEGGDA